MSTDNLDFLTGEVGSGSLYEPVAKDKFTSHAADAEIIDPVALGWGTPSWAVTPEQQREASAPRGRVRWKIESDALGGTTPYANRIVDQTVLLTPGFNPKTGRSNLEALADLIRLRYGLTAKQETTGYKLYETDDLKGLDRATAIQLLNQRFKEAVIGLKGVIRVIHIKGEDGPQDRVGKIVLPK